MNGGKRMRTFSYKKLFKKLIDLDMTNIDGEGKYQ